MFSDIGICAGKCSFLRYEELNFMMESGLWDGNEEDMMETGALRRKVILTKKADYRCRLRAEIKVSSGRHGTDMNCRCRFFEKV